MTTPQAQGRSKKTKVKKLYRIDILIQEKADKESTTPAIIREQARKTLNISVRHFYNIRMAKKGSAGDLNTSQLLALSKYFNVTVQDLLSDNL